MTVGRIALYSLLVFIVIVGLFAGVTKILDAQGHLPKKYDFSGANDLPAVGSHALAVVELGVVGARSAVVDAPVGHCLAAPSRSAWRQSRQSCAAP